MRGECYTCLSWARPTNPNGDLCTTCAKLYDQPLLGGVHASVECYSCVVNLDEFCTREHSCSDPPQYHDDLATPYHASVEEIKRCWQCMRQHRFYHWGTYNCGEPAQLPGGVNPLPPLVSL
eukprot:354287-Chlamydomonas_euryale.AAC.6